MRRFCFHSLHTETLIHRLSLSLSLALQDRDAPLPPPLAPRDTDERARTCSDAVTLKHFFFYTVIILQWTSDSDLCGSYGRLHGLGIEATAVGAGAVVGFEENLLKLDGLNTL